MAGVSTKEIKTRIRSMESTKQITKAMEMVAASKLRRAQLQVQSARPYFEVLRETMQDIVNTNREMASPYLMPRPVKRAAWVVIAGDRGLAGGYNSNVLKLAYGQMPDVEVTVLPVGKKAVEFFKARQLPMLTEQYREAEEVSVGDCFSMAKALCRAYCAGEVDAVHVAYTRFDSVLAQTPVSLALLPLQPEDRPRSGGEVLYEPDPETVFESIVPEYLGGVLYGALCESRGAEQAARRAAMDAATQNAEEMIGDLRLKFNRARQAAITQEITEIVAGSRGSE